MALKSTHNNPRRTMQERQYNSGYEGENIGKVAFPLGGIGAGMICLEGCGALSHVSLRNQPDMLNEPQVFSALCLKGVASDGGNVARVLEGPVPGWKIMGVGGGEGGRGKTYGLPRFRQARFDSRFPFATISLSDEAVPVSVEITGWSPFTPPEPDDSSLPVAALEFRFANHTDQPIEGVYSFHARNFMTVVDADEAVVRQAEGGFEFYQPSSHEKPWNEGSFCAVTDDRAVQVNHAWFRGGWFDPLTMVWKSVAEGATIEQPPITAGQASVGASLYVPFRLSPGEDKTIRLRLGWYVPGSTVCQSYDMPVETWDIPYTANDRPTYEPWYISKFASIGEVMQYWRENYERLRDTSESFANCFYDSTLPPEVIEAIGANLTILKSPTCLRQRDGRFWGWEGCENSAGCCFGNCTHVWNYAQSLPHLFPSLERTIHETELNESLRDDGFQWFRTPIPIREMTTPATGLGATIPAAADGQLGSIMRVYREWRISGDSDWLKPLWTQVKRSLDFCIETWDPERIGALVEPHHDTYDIQFWGPGGMCSSMYLGALKATIAMGRALDHDITPYESLLEKGRSYLEEQLFDGEYFIQKVMWEGLRTADPTVVGLEAASYDSPESKELLRQEGPKYQYGTGCLSDGVLGAWIAEVCGVGEILDPKKVESHLLAVHKYNFRKDLSSHANPQRPTYALNDEAGLLLCCWPKGGEPSLPFVYSNEVWTGIEYQVAAHLMTMGHVEKGLEIVRACRDRYDGTVRNPFNEYECGHWYARAMSSYGMLQGLTGIRYDAVEKILYFRPRIKGDFRSFLSTAKGYGTAGIKNKKPFLEVVCGDILVHRMEYATN